MSLRRDNELLSDEDGLDPQQKFGLGLTLIGAILGFLGGDLPGLLFGAAGGYGIAVIIIAVLTWLSRFLPRR